MTSGDQSQRLTGLALVLCVALGPPMVCRCNRALQSLQVPPIRDFLESEGSARAACSSATVSVHAAASSAPGADATATGARSPGGPHRAASGEDPDAQQQRTQQAEVTETSCAASQPPQHNGATFPAHQTGSAQAEGGRDAWAEFRVPDAVLQKAAWCIDVVTPDCHSANCFTKSYGQYTKGAGSVLATRNLHVLDSFGDWGHREKVSAG